MYLISGQIITVAAESGKVSAVLGLWVTPTTTSEIVHVLHDSINHSRSARSAVICGIGFPINKAAAVAAVIV